MATTRTVFLNSSLPDYAALAARFDSGIFNVVALDGGSQQIQDFLTANHMPASSLTVVSASGASDGLFTPRVVFVDPGVDDYQVLVAGMPANTTVVLLDATRDGVEQIRDYLAHNTGLVSAIDIITDIASLDVVSHGAPGEVMLGSTVLNAETLAQYGAQLAEIGSHLTANGDILLYGCDVASGSAGQQFIEKLAQATSADVAASTDLTGAGAAGGDWVLEASSGAIETNALHVDSYGSTLNVLSAAISIAQDTGSSATDFITKIEQVATVSYSTNAGNSKIYVWINGSKVADLSTSNAGNYTWSTPSPLTAGTYTIIVNSNDTDPTKGQYTTPRTINIDTSIATPSITLQVDSTDGGAGHATDKITNNAAVTFSAVEGDATRVIKLDNVVVGSYNPATVSEGVHALQVTDTDTAGNVATTTLNFTLDKTVATPTMSLAVDSTDGGAGHNTDRITNDASITFSALESGATRVTKVDGVTVASYNPAALANGSHTVQVTDTDVAGNSAASSNFTFTVDRSITTPTLSLAVDSTDGGAGHDTDKRTSNAAINFGAADAGATRVIKVDGVTVGAYNPAALADGAHTVQVTDTDIAGNVATGSLSFTLDKSIAAPTLALSTDSTDGASGHGADKITNDAHLNISALESDASRVIKVDGTVVGSYDPAALSEGNHTVQVIDTDTAGNSATSSLTFRLDKSIATPALGLANDSSDGGTGHASDKVTNDAGITLSALEADASRVIKVDGATVPNYNPAALGEGNHTVQVIDTDVAGNSATSSLTFKLDKSIAAPTLALANDSSDGGAGHAADKITNDAHVTFSALEADASRVIKVDGSAVATFDPAGLGDGSHTVEVVDTDVAGNSSSATLAFTVDKSITAPALALSSDTSDGAAGHDTDHRTSNAAVNFSSLDSDASRKIKVDGSVVAGYNPAGLADGDHTVEVTDTDKAGNTATTSLDFKLDTKIAQASLSLTNDSSDGGAGHSADKVTNDAHITFSALETDASRVIKVDGSAVASYDPTALGEGNHTVLVTDTDTAGNSSSASLSFQVDKSIAAPTLALTSDSTDGGTGHDADKVTNDAHVTFSALEGDASRVIKVDGSAVATYDPSGLGDGDHTVEVIDTDVAGNSSSATLAFTVDKSITAPALALSSDSSDGVAGHDTDHRTSNAAVSFSPLDSDSTRQIKVDGSVVAGYNLAGLADGDHTVEVTDTDKAGNTATASLAFNLDTKIAPASLSLTNDSSDGGVGHAADKVTNDAHITFSALEIDASRVIKVDGSAVASYDPAALGEGNHTVLVTDTDTAGNSSTASLSFQVDKSIAAPTLALTSDSTDGGTGNDADKVTNDAHVTFSALEGDASRVIKVDGSAVATFDPAGLGDGSHTVEVFDTDVAGNSSSATLAFTVDKSITAPALALSSDTSDGAAGHDTDHRTSNAAVNFSALDSDATRQIKVDGSVVAGYNPAGLADGDHTVEVIDTDKAGNSATASLAFNLDTKIAQASLSLTNDSSDGGAGHSADNVTNDAHITFSALEADASRVIKVDGSTVASYDPAALGEGNHTVLVTDTDIAGNSSTASLTFQVDKSIATPTMALTNDSTDGGAGHAADKITNDAHVTFSTLDADASRVIKVDGSAVTAYDPSGLGDGSHTVEVLDTDVAGNSSSATLTFTVDKTITAPALTLSSDTSDGAAGHDTDHRTGNAAVNFSPLDSDATRQIKVDGSVVAGYNPAGLADGDHTIEVTDTDKAGNSATASLAFNLDTNIAQTSLSLTNDSSDGATGHAADKVTNDAHITFSALETDASRVIRVDGSTVASYDPAALGQGNHTVVVTDTDTAGNSSTASMTFLVDKSITAPTLALTNDSSDGGTGNDADKVTNDAHVTFSALEADASRVIKVDGSAVATYDPSGLGDGDHTVEVIDTDVAGNSSSATLAFTVDKSITAPALALSSDTSDGVAGHDTDHRTSNAAVSFSPLDSDSTRQIKVDGSVVAGYNLAGLADGDHTVEVIDTDKAGNMAVTRLDFKLDTKIAQASLSLTNDSSDGGAGHSTDKVTNDAHITFSALEADASRVIKVDGSTVANYDPAALGEGNHTVLITDTDTAGNSSTASMTFQVDKSIATPTMALTNDSSDGGAGHDADKVTNDAHVTFSVLEADASRVVKVDGSIVASYDPAALGEGNHTIQVTDTDIAGNSSSASVTFLVDKSIATPALALTNDSTDGGAGHDADKVTIDARVTFSALEADASRVIKVDGSAVTTYDPSGLGDGSHTVEVIDTDIAGNSSSATLAFAVDKSITVPALTLASDTSDGATGHDADHRTSNAAVSFSPLDSDATRQVKVDGNVVGSYNPAGLADGDHTVEVTDTDKTGNSATTSLTFKLDTKIAQASLSLTNDSSDGGAGHSGDKVTNDAHITFSALEADASRMIKVDGSTVSGFDPSVLGDGSHTVLVTDTDTAGNSSAASLTFQVDKSITAPTLALTNDSTDGSTGHDADRVTNDAHVNFSVLEADASRVIKVDGSVVTNYNPSGLGEGDHTVEVIDTDIAGNSSSATLAFTVDKSITGPALALSSDTSDGVGAHGSDHRTSNAAVSFSPLDSDATRQVKVDGNVVASYNPASLSDGDHTVEVLDTDKAGNTATASLAFSLDTKIATASLSLTNDSSDGGAGHASDKVTNDAHITFSTLEADASRVIKVDGSAVASYDAAALGEGSHTVLVTDTDTAGNSSTASLTFQLDKSIAAPAMALTNDSTDGGAGHGADKVTNDAHVTFSALEADASRVIKVDGSAVASYDPSALGEGNHTVQVIDTDAAGNSSTANLGFKLDKSIASPTLALANDSTDGGTGNSSDKVSNDASVTFSALEADATRVIKVDGSVVASYNPASLADGGHTVEVIDTDTAGNSASASLAFTVDKSITAAALQLAVDSTDGAAGHDTDRLTNNANVTFSALDADAARIIKVDGSAVASYDASAMGEGAHTVQVTDTDKAGNVSTAVLAFTLDTKLTQPTLSLQQDTTDGAAGHDTDAVTSNAALVFSAKDADTARVIKVDGNVVANYNPALLADGAHTVMVTDTDVAGNSKSASLSFTLDATAPAAQAIALAVDSTDGAGAHGSDKISNDASLSVSASEPGATRSFIVDGGAATASYTAPGGQGIHHVTVTDTDIAGNATSRTLDFTLDTLADVQGDLKVTLPDVLVNLAERANVAYSVQGLDADAGAFVTFSDGVNSVVSSSGFANLSTLLDGTIQVSVAARDIAGNTFNGLGSSLVLDSKAPVFTSSATASIMENSGANAAVYTAAANDANGTTYSLLSVAGDDSSAFWMDAGGVVRMTAGADYESKNSYKFTVQATDSAGNSSLRAVTLAVGDVNEAPDTVPIALSTVENAAIVIQLVPDYAYDLDAGDSVSIKSVGNVTLTWAPDSTSNSLVNPVTKQAVSLGMAYAEAAISTDGKGITISPSGELDWATTGQKVIATVNYVVRDSHGLETPGSISLSIWGSTADKGKNMVGSNGNDVMTGDANGENVLQGGNGNDTLNGGASTDALYGGNGDDKVYGGNGIDYLYGDSGNDTLDGGALRDILFGGKGNDILTGGTGGDYFVFEPQLGNDKITDFKFSEGDKLYFLDFFATVPSAHDFVTKYAKVVGSDMLISLPGGGITLVGVTDKVALEGALVFNTQGL